jgi:hypothetical protein
VVDIADDVLLDAVGLDDGNGAFDGHDNLKKGKTMTAARTGRPAMEAL